MRGGSWFMLFSLRIIDLLSYREEEYPKIPEPPRADF